MTEYEAYPEYKDSEVGWLGPVPESWTVYRLKNLATIKSGQDCKSIQADDGYPVMGSGGQFTFASKFMYDKPSVLLGRKGTINKPLHINEPSWAVDTVYCTELNEGFDARCLHYLAFTIQFSRRSTNTTLPSMTQEHLNNYKFSVPKTKSEREKITEFLDPETAKIDNLIEKQQQLIELLRGKRQAIISRAVTKELGPDIPMKDSGVEWLGEVPGHWEILKFRYISLVVRGGLPRPTGNPTLFNGDYSPWVTVAEITKNSEIHLDSTDIFLTKKGNEQCRVSRAGTLLLSSNGATLGVPKILSIDASANDGVVGFELLNINHEYAYFYLSTLITDLGESIKQGSGQPNLNTEIVKPIAIPIPPENEIQRVASFIKGTVRLYSSIESGAMEQVKLLQERRAALVSVAVTGKIDVHDWVTPDMRSIEEPQEATA